MTTDSLKIWAHNLAGITGRIRQSDPQLRTLLHTGPGSADEVSALLNQVKPTLPVLLANLTTVGQVLVTYNKSVEQLLVLLPPYIAAIQSSTPVNNPTGQALGDFSLTIADPPACTVGFLPRSAWRAPSDTTEVDTPDGLYCKLPQDSPIAVRGARNYPCVEHPGKRAATVQDCDSDKPFEPLATRQHALGPSPIDPNLIAQGVPPDTRVTNSDRIFGPLDGTPMPPAPARTDAAPPPSEPAPVTGAQSVAPSGYANQPQQPAPVAIARYNPETGAYLAPDGHLYAQSNLVATAPKSWTDLVMTSE